MKNPPGGGFFFLWVKNGTENNKGNKKYRDKNETGRI
jgi:hypothetical protein